RVEGERAEAARARAELDRLSEELAPLGALKAELQELDRRFSEEGRRLALGRQEGELYEELTRLRERLAKYETAPGLETQAADDVDRARAELSENDRQLDAARTGWLTERQAA